MVLVGALEHKDGDRLDRHHYRVKTFAADRVSLIPTTGGRLIAAHRRQHSLVRLNNASSTLFVDEVAEHVGQIVLDDIVLDGLNLHRHVVVLQFRRAKLLDLVKSQV